MVNQAISYYSTNFNAPHVSFGEALLKGLAPDNGLYMPDRIPVIDKNILANLSDKTYPEIAFIIAKNFLNKEIPDNDLMKIVTDAYNFNVPVEKIYNRRYIMRLDQGPTASFKDFAARMMGRLMQFYLQKAQRRMLILTATSGDTGSAIANAFYGLENIEVVILFPEHEVTPRQRKQMTTLRKNIKILALNAKFDDCQALVKKAFMDKDLADLNLSSANSINIGRLLPQSFYYFYAWSKVADTRSLEKIIFAIPSGNFGNMMGGLLAAKMGLPVHKFIIATNENDEVPVYWNTGRYATIVPSKNCISSAMNVGHPSNMARVITLYGGKMDEKGNIIKGPDVEKMHQEINAVSISDKLTADTIKDAWQKHGIVIEPHGAAGWAGLNEYISGITEEKVRELPSVCLETAHPAKFPGEIKRLLNTDPALPPSMIHLDHLEESYQKLENHYPDFKKYLLNRYL